MADPILRELMSKIQQFLSHQYNTNLHLSEGSRESLTVAIDCIEEAFQIERSPASDELLQVYKTHKQRSSTAPQATPHDSQIPFLAELQSSPFIQNLASSLLSQAASTFAGENQTPTSSSSLTTNRTPRQRRSPTREEIEQAEEMKNQGNELMRTEQYRDAYNKYTDALRLVENNPVYYSNRAAASGKLGNYQSAVDDCLQAIEVEPAYSKAYARMGLAYASMGNHAKAKESYSKAVELEPTNQSYRNNLSIAEEKTLQQQQQAPHNASNGTQGDLSNSPGLMDGIGNVVAGMLGHAGSNANLGNMLRSLLNNPDVVQMAMRSLQDPRVQDLLDRMSQPGGNNPQNNPTGNQPR